MIGLFYLLPVALYVLLAIVIFGSLRERSRSAARISAVIAVGIPAWFFWGYRLADNYSEFRAACSDDTAPQIVKPIATEIPYIRYCSEARRILPDSNYTAIECKQGIKTVRLTFNPDVEGLSPDGSRLVQCRTPVQYGQYFEECYNSEIIDEITTPYSETREVVANVHSAFTSGIMRATETRISLPDETLVAYQRRYHYLPYGDRRLLGGSSGMAPRIQCKGRPTYPRITEMFPSL